MHSIFFLKNAIFGLKPAAKRRPVGPDSLILDLTSQAAADSYSGIIRFVVADLEVCFLLLDWPINSPARDFAD